MANPDSPSGFLPRVGGEGDYVLPADDSDFYPVTKASEHPLPNVRDKGYAWVVIAVMFLSNVVTTGYIKSFGITYNAIAQAYPGTSATSGGVLIALLAGCRNVLAPFVGALGVRFGYRPVMMFGVLLCSTGLFSSYFCHSVPALAVTLGAIMGVGMCAIETCQVVVLSDYFQEKKEIANSIRVAGNPLGGVALPFFVAVGGIGTTLIPFSRGFWGVLSCITFSSVALSGYNATVSVMLLDLFGRNNVASSWGFIWMLQGLLKFAFPPLLGLLVDVSGHFLLTFLTMGSGLLFAALCIAVLPLVARTAGMDVTFQ